MKGELNYRGYIISKFGDEYIARPVDQDEGSPDIVASHLSQLIHRVDEMWHCIVDTRAKKPAWIRKWLKNPTLHCLRPDELIRRQRQCCRRIKLSVITAVFGTLVIGGANAGPGILDFDGDGQITKVDFDHMVHRLTSGTASLVRLLEINGQIFRVAMEPTPDPNTDWKVTRIEKVSEVDKFE